VPDRSFYGLRGQKKSTAGGEYYFNSSYATNGKSMATDKYPEHKALNPFFDVVMKRLNGLVDGEHYYDAIAENAQFEFLYCFPGWAEVIHGRDNLIAAYSGYGNNIVLEKGDGLAVHHDKERGVVTLEYQVHGKAVKTGAAYDNRFASIVTIKNRKIVLWRQICPPISSNSQWNRA
jgi:ketosteroid isomerase-like protein